MNIIKKFTFAAVTAIAVGLLFQPLSTLAGASGHKGGEVRRGDRHHRSAKITWTKHATEFLTPPGPTGLFATILGAAQGDIGEGNVTGEAFNPTPQPDGSLVFEAVYHFYGSKHSLTVHFDIVQQPDGSGVMAGVVTDGWLKGKCVVAQYTSQACDQGVNGVCFDGSLEIDRN